jgi:hypothetical protein
MDRRTALKAAGATLASASLPAWLASGLSCRSRDAGEGSPLRHALERARELGKPVVVVVAPSDPSEAVSLGFTISEAVEVGGEELLASLALAEVACASAEQLRELIGSVSKGDVVGVLEERDGAFAWTSVVWERTAPAVASHEDQQRALRERGASNAASLTLALSGPAVAERRAAAARRALPARALDEVECALAVSTELDLATVDAAAALLHGAGPRWRPPLAQAARARVWDAPPRGARWANDLGCGREIELLERDGDELRHDLRLRAYGMRPESKPPSGDPTMLWPPFPAQMPACGMATTPRVSRRFLLFYTEEAL